eukprot:SM000078S22137  [mRNA]  locus=s78:610738:616326:- [translate_table: standard]
MLDPLSTSRILLELIWQVQEAARGAKEHLHHCMLLSDRLDGLRPVFQELLEGLGSPFDVNKAEAEAVLGTLDRHERADAELQADTSQVLAASPQLGGALREGAQDLHHALGRRVTDEINTGLQDLMASLERYMPKTSAALQQLMEELEGLEFVVPEADGGLAPKLAEQLQGLEELLQRQLAASMEVEQELQAASASLEEHIQEEVAEELQGQQADLQQQLETARTLLSLFQRAEWVSHLYAKKLLADLLEQKRTACAQEEATAAIRALLGSDGGGWVEREVSGHIEALLEARSEGGPPAARVERRAAELAREVTRDLRYSLHEHLKNMQASRVLLDACTGSLDDRLWYTLLGELHAQTADLREQTRLVDAVLGVLEARSPKVFEACAVEWGKLRKELALQQAVLRKQACLDQKSWLTSFSASIVVLNLQTSLAERPSSMEEDFYVAIMDEFRSFNKVMRQQARAVSTMAPALDTGITEVERQLGTSLAELSVKPRGLSRSPSKPEAGAYADVELTSPTTKPRSEGTKSARSFEQRLEAFLVSIWYGTGPDKDAAAAVLLQACKQASNSEQRPEADKGLPTALSTKWVKGLVSALYSDSNVVQAASASAMTRLANTEDSRLAFVSAHAPKALVAILKEGLPEAKGKAVTTLASLVSTDQTRESILSTGAVEIVVPLLKYQSKETRDGALLTLKNLVYTQPRRGSTMLDKVRASVVHSGAVPMLVALLSSSESQEDALAVIAGLVQSRRDAIGMQSKQVVDSLLTFLPSASRECQRYAAEAISSFAHSEQDIELLVEADVLPGLLQCLRSGPDGVKVLASSSIASIAGYPSKDFRSVIASHGAVLPLVEVLQGTAPMGVKLHAAQALAHLCESDHVRSTVVAAGAVAPMVDLLKANTSLQAKSNIVWAISLMGREPNAVKEVIATGAISVLAALLKKNHQDQRLALALASALCILAGQDKRLAAAMRDEKVKPVLDKLAKSSDNLELAHASAATLKWLNQK